MTKHFNPGEFRRKNAGARVDDHLELKDVMDALKARDAEIKSFAEKASAEIKDTGQMAAETKAALDKITGEATTLHQRMLDVEQRLASRGGSGGGAVKSLGEQFVESPDFKDLQTRGRGTARLSVKSTIISGPNRLDDSPSEAGGAGALIRPDRLAGVVAPAERELTIRDLLLPGRTSSNAIEYVEEVGYTNAAAPVAEGAEKPQSDLTFDLVSRPVRTIAHWFAASKQVLSDVPMLMSYIDGRARYGLRYVEEEQLLLGDGAGQNLRGLIPSAKSFNNDLREEDDTAIDTIRRASLQVRLAELRPSFVVMHPTDWAGIETQKDDEKRYIMVTIPVAGAAPRLWRLDVVETTAVPPGEFLVGAGAAAQIFDREDAAVEVSTEHADFFTKNLVAIRAEERLVLAVYRPESFVYGAFEQGGG